MVNWQTFFYVISSNSFTELQIISLFSQSIETENKPVFFTFQDEYFAEYGGSVIPVRANNVFMALHMNLVIVVQVLVFEVLAASLELSRTSTVKVFCENE